MQSSRPYYKQLLSGFIHGSNTPEQVRELYAFIRQQPDLYEQLMNEPDILALVEEKADASAAYMPATTDQRIRERLMSGVAGEERHAKASKFRVIRNWWWAAAVLFILAAGAMFWLQRAPRQDMTVADVAPGTQKAMLTLADGSTVTLDNTGNRVIPQEGTAVQQQGGLLVYDVQRSGDRMQYNTLATPRGGQFRIQLPDGTMVWLNAASSLKYPTAFTGKERRVWVTGEAYFEVVKNTQMPFRVEMNGQTEIEVLGTHFNVSAYENEVMIRTTLLEGSVRVWMTGGERLPAGKQIRTGNASTSGSFVTMQPGQQAQITTARTGQSASPAIKLLEHVDMENTVAWKEGIFNFNGLSFEAVMRQLERWYDIEVVFEKNVPTMELIGEMSRDIPLSGVLRYLGNIGIHYRLEERKLVIL